MIKHALLLIPTIFIANCLLLWCSSPATAIVIDAIQDTWIRESAPDNDYNGDLISVWDGTTSDQKRHGAILFDLSSVGGTITSAFLQLFDRDDNRSMIAPIVQEAYLLSTTPPSPGFDSPYTWNEYLTFDDPNEVLLESLGHYNIGAGDLIDGYEASELASASDITLLQQTSNNNSNRVAFILKAVSGERDWGDIEFDSAPPRLVINESLPVLGDFTGDGFVRIADYNVIIDPLNWLQSVPIGTRGDITGDGFVGLDDFSQFKPIYHEANPGSGSSVVPEPSFLAYLLTAAAVLGLVFGLRRRQMCLVPVKLLVAAIALLSSAPSISRAIVLEATTDIWIRELSPTTTFENDLISVWNSFSTGPDAGMRRYGVLEFDLSSLDGVQLNFASLNLWNGDNGFSDDDKAIKQSAVYIDTTGGTQASGMTWSIYQSEYANSATALAGLGSFNLPAQAAPDAFSNSANATAADLALLANVASAAGGGNQRLTLVLIADEADAVEYAHSWGDGPDGFAGMNPQLLINEAPPEQVELTLQINSATGAMWIANPGVDPAEDTVFDIDGYVIHSPAGALNPGGFTGLSGAGEDDWQIIAPSISNISELNLDTSTVFSEGDSLPLGFGFTPGATEDSGLTFQYNVNGGAPISGLVEYLSGDLDGDYNGDGTVNAADYTVWRDGGSPDSSQAGYQLWRSNFGAGIGSGAPAAVPEPTALGLIAISLVGLAAIRRRPAQV
ncbi:MAG: PEP-CTERM sorting domain-containing protein [Pirellulales bacterium]